MTTTTMATTHEHKIQSLRKRICEPRRSKGLCFFPPRKDLVVTGEEEEEETRRNKTSRRHQNLKASSSRGGPQFVKGNKSSATKYLHTCAADMEPVAKTKKKKKAPRTRRGPRRRRPEDEAREGSGIPTRARQASGQEAAGTREKEQAMQAGRPTTCNTLCGTATDWWYRTVPKWTQAKWTYSTSALALCT
ncbi:unnamed protein product [Sphagnum balticum]